MKTQREKLLDEIDNVDNSLRLLVEDMIVSVSYLSYVRTKLQSVRVEVERG